MLNDELQEGARNAHRLKRRIWLEVLDPKAVIPIMAGELAAEVARDFAPAEIEPLAEMVAFNVVVDEMAAVLRGEE